MFLSFFVALAPPMSMTGVPLFFICGERMISGSIRESKAVCAAERPA
jgi:hypothetical protein